MIKKRVVITGLGSISPAGNTIELWNAVLNKKNCLSYYNGEFADALPVEVIGKVKNNIEGIFPPKLARYISRHTGLGAKALAECITNSKLLDISEAGLLFSSASQGHEVAKEMFCTKEDDIIKLNNRNLDSITNAGACHLIASVMGFSGIIHAVDAASCGGLLSLFVGTNYIKNSVCDKIFSVVGEANLALATFLFYNKNVRFAKVSSNFYGKLANREARQLENYVIPFSNPNVSDRGAISEAGTAILIESLESAENRNAKIIAEIEQLSYGFYAENYSGGDKDNLGLLKILKQYEKEEIDALYLPVTGSYPLDYGIYTTCFKIFGKKHVFTAEPCIGHTGSASGHINIILACKSFENSILPATKNVQENSMDEEFKLKVLNKPLNENINRILVISSGWGGYYAACLLKKSL